MSTQCENSLAKFYFEFSGSCSIEEETCPQSQRGSFSRASRSDTSNLYPISLAAWYPEATVLASWGTRQVRRKIPQPEGQLVNNPPHLPPPNFPNSSSSLPHPTRPIPNRATWIRAFVREDRALHPAPDSSPFSYECDPKCLTWFSHSSLRTLISNLSLVDDASLFCDFSPFPSPDVQTDSSDRDVWRNCLCDCTCQILSKVCLKIQTQVPAP